MEKYSLKSAVFLYLGEIPASLFVQGRLCPVFLIFSARGWMNNPELARDNNHRYKKPCSVQEDSKLIQNIPNQINQCEQIIQQMMGQTQQSTQMYQQMLQQEQQNAAQLEALAQREQKAVQMIQNALHGHQLAMQQMQQVSQICKQLEQAYHSAAFGTFNQQAYNTAGNQQQLY